MDNTLDNTGEVVTEAIGTTVDRFWIIDKLFSDIDFAQILGKVIMIAIILVLTKIVTKVLDKVIDKFFRSHKKIKRFGMSSRKADTLSVITQSSARYMIYFIAIVMVLQEVGIETRSLIATAGIGGVAIGFGAKSLVQDVITGFFILFEDQFSVGEHIQIDRFEGTVEDMQIRVTKIRDFNGELHIIPNGNISIVTNKSRGSMKASVDIRLPYGEDYEEVIRILEEVSKEIKAEYGSKIIEGPTINGIGEFTSQDIRVNMFAMTKPGNQGVIGYAMRKMALERLNESTNIAKLGKVVLDSDKKQES